MEKTTFCIITLLIGSGVFWIIRHNEGFVAAIYDPVTGFDHHEVYPLMDIETLALVVGNVFEGYQIGKNSALKEVQDMLE